MFEDVVNQNRARKSKPKFDIWLAISTFLLLLYLTITTTLNVRDIKNLSQQLQDLKMNITRLENSNYGNNNSINYLDRRNDENADLTVQV